MTTRRRLSARKRAEVTATISHLEQYLASNRWPSGLELTAGDRDVIERNLVHLRDELAR